MHPLFSQWRKFHQIRMMPFPLPIALNGSRSAWGSPSILLSSIPALFLTSVQVGFFQPLQSIRLAAPLANLRQTILFGTQAQGVPSQTQSSRKHNWPTANREEPPTHHKLDREALATWVYPTNLGTIRDYHCCCKRFIPQHARRTTNPSSRDRPRMCEH